MEPFLLGHIYYKIPRFQERVRWLPRFFKKLILQCFKRFYQKNYLSKRAAMLTQASSVLRKYFTLCVVSIIRATFLNTVERQLPDSQHSLVGVI